MKTITTGEVAKIAKELSAHIGNPSRFYVFTSAVLPYEWWVEASDIETRQPVKILTGEMVHVIQVDNHLYVSQELWDELAKLAKR